MKSRLTDTNLYDRILSILKERPDLRDSDSRLITYVWYVESGWFGHDVKTMSAFEFLNLLRTDKLTSSESIRRCRQKVQEQNADTRGQKYKERHKKELEVRGYYSKAS